MTDASTIAARFGAGNRQPDQPRHPAMERYLAACERARRATKGNRAIAQVRRQDAMTALLEAETIPFLPLPTRSRKNVTA